MNHHVKSISKKDAETALSDWIQRPNSSSKQEDYEDLRQELMKLFEKSEEYKQKNEYTCDIHFAALLYDYLNEQPWFSLRMASDDGFWRFLSVIIIPNVVYQRWGDSINDHSWKKSNRIWLKNMWWYIHLSFHDSTGQTLELLSKPMFNTDTVLNLVERTGNKGIYVETYRKLMYYYSTLPIETIFIFKKKRTTKSSDSLFRSLMKLNTVRLMVIDPMLVDGGVDAYVRGLFADLQIKI